MGKPSGVEWWTQKIDKLNARLKSIRQYLRKWLYRRMARNLPEFTSNDMKYSWEDLKTARLQFKKACRKAKKRHWRKRISEIDRTVVTASINKMMNKENNAEIGLFTKPNGQRCAVDETMDLLKDTHFPGNTTTKPLPTQPLAAKVKITSKEAAFITPERLKACIRSFIIRVWNMECVGQELTMRYISTKPELLGLD